MGRDAFFDTGLEYRLAFATQDSLDIQTFGGTDTTSRASLACGHYTHAWDASKDAAAILEKLRNYVEDTELLLPPFDEFTADLDGTHELRNWLYEKQRDYIDWIGSDFYTFKLGCLIYHQLTYEPALGVHYHP